MLDNISRRIVGSFALALLALAAGACGQCGGSDPTATDADPAAVVPDTPPRASVALAAYVPADATWFAAFRDPEAILEGYVAIRPHVEAVLGGNLGMVETDLRNTLSLDLTRPDSLAAAGIARNGGVSVYRLDDQLVIGVLVSDRALFEEKMSATLQARPFDLRADVERRRVGDATLLAYRRTDGQPPEFAMATLPNHAFFFPKPPAGDALDALVDAATRTRDESLATAQAFLRSVDTVGDAHVHFFSSAENTSEAQRASALAFFEERGADPAAAASVVDRWSALGAGSLGASLTADGLDVEVVHRPAQELLDGYDQITSRDAPSALGPLAVPDVYAFLRLTVAPSEMYAFGRGLLGEGRRAALDEALATHQERVGMDPIDELMPALGQNVLVLLTRARLLTLSRAMNSGSPGELFSGLGVVIALEVRDAAVVKAALESIVPSLDGRASLFESGGHTVVEFTDAEADVGNLVLTDDMLLLVPQRQRDEVLAQLASGTVDLGWCDVPDARTLVSDPSANGVFVDVRRVVDGPIGQVALARLPVEVRRALGRVGRLHVRTHRAGDGIVTQIGLRLDDPGDD